MNAITPFRSDMGDVRVVERDGQPWFVLADLCALLGLKNPTVAAKPLDETEKAMHLIGGQREATIVSLAGAVTLMVRCHGAMKPGTLAYRVRKWITGEVVPAVLRTGSYGAPATGGLPRDPRQLLAYLQQQAGDMIALQDENATLAPKADAFNRIADAHGSLTFTEAAKVLKVGRDSLIRFMQTNGWIYRAPGNGRWMGYRAKEVASLIEHRVSRVPRTDGTERVVQSPLITSKGLAKLATILPTMEIRP